MHIGELLQNGRAIWGATTLSLNEVIIHLNIVSGDISRISRDVLEGQALDEAELKKELGNIIFSTIRWCDDLGYDPEECIILATQAQVQYWQKLSRKSTPNVD